ncbi:uncharacterized protein LOC142234978 [Haematobia irritans]|uniref:uncharacterized protein LOC142234978 n=1 Tax=Haematobia irritans TaxID=7368 RepID=UPI003F4FEB6E
MGIDGTLVIVLIAIGMEIYGIQGADDVIDCSNEELVTSVFNDPIALTLNGTIKIYDNVLINDILSTSNNEFDLKYIDARLENGTNVDDDENATLNLVIFTTENFPNYAKEQTASRISLKINLGCGSGKERILVFFQPLKEDNYYDPIFSQSQYEILMPTPIFAGFELTSFIEISAKDDDLTQNEINFTSTTSIEHYISVGTKNITSNDKKTYFANITLERIYLELPREIEFVITAMDNGTPSRSSNATVIIRSHPLKRMPMRPQFMKHIYNGIIRMDFSMEPIRIELIQGSYQAEVIFILDGGVSETNGFEIIDYKNGNIDIQWNAQKVGQSTIMELRKWTFQVKAQHPQMSEMSVATVIVELEDFQSFFHFMSTYYEGSIDSEGQLEMFPIIFYPMMYKPDIKFSLLENPRNMFNISNTNFQVHLHFMPNFTLDAFAEEAFIKLTLKATWKQLSAITYLLIRLPEKLQNIPVQQQLFDFEKPLYVGNFTIAGKEIAMEEIILLDSITNTNASQLKEFKLKGEWSHLFLVIMEKQENQSQVHLEFNLTDVIDQGDTIQLKSPLVLVLEAKQDNFTVYCSIVLDDLEAHYTMDGSTIVFMSHSVIGKLEVRNGQQSLVIDSIQLQHLDNLKDYEFLVEGDESTKFQLMPNLSENLLRIELKENLANDTIQSSKLLILQIHAKPKMSMNISDSLMIFIELPEKECLVPNKPSADPPSFSNSKYIFTTFTNTTGSLGVIRAYSSQTDSIFHYILEVFNDTLAQRLSIEPFSGELMLYGSLDEGSYNFNVTAENLETREQAKVQALLKVSQKQECKIFEGVAVDRTLVIRHIDEEMAHHGIWDMKFNENCTFRIMEMWPGDKEYVYLNESSMKLDVMAVDREDSIFTEMKESQILIKLKLVCGDLELEPNRTERSTRSLSSFDTIYAQDIIYSPDSMWLHLIIDDINDNAPQFKEKYSLDYFAYPSGKSPLDIYPEYLMQVETVDLDVGLNAQIQYSMRSNPYFDIEPETGKIYPRGMMLRAQQQTELIILATDRNGQGLVTGTVIIVKGLAADSYSLVTLKENSTKSLNEITQELREMSGYDVKIIKMSYVPQAAQFSRADDGQLVCKAWIYAYRDQQLVQCKELQEKLLDKSPTSSIVSIESYDEAALHMSPLQNTPSTLVYMVAVTILSLVSASSIIFIVWHFYFNGRLPFNCSTNDHHCTTSHQNHENNAATECSHSATDNHQTNHVKFSGLIENVTIGGCDEK